MNKIYPSGNKWSHNVDELVIQYIIWLDRREETERHFWHRRRAEQWNIWIRQPFHFLHLNVSFWIFFSESSAQDSFLGDSVNRSIHCDMRSTSLGSKLGIESFSSGNRQSYVQGIKSANRNPSILARCSLELLFQLKKCIEHSTWVTKTLSKAQWRARKKNTHTHTEYKTTVVKAVRHESNSDKWICKSVRSVAHSTEKKPIHSSLTESGAGRNRKQYGNKIMQSRNIVRQKAKLKY